MNKMVNLRIAQKDKEFLKEEIGVLFYLKGHEIRKIVSGGVGEFTPAIEEWYQLGRIYAASLEQSIPYFFDSYCRVNRWLPKECYEFVNQMEINGDF